MYSLITPHALAIGALILLPFIAIGLALVLDRAFKKRKHE